MGLWDNYRRGSADPYGFAGWYDPLELARQRENLANDVRRATGLGNFAMRSVPGASPYGAAPDGQMLRDFSVPHHFAAAALGSANDAEPFSPMSDAEMDLLKPAVSVDDPEPSDSLFQSDRGARTSGKTVRARERADRSMPPSNIDGGEQGDALVLARGGYRTVDDPTLAGVNAEIRRRLGMGQSAAAITAYLEKVRRGLGRELLPQVAEAVKFRRQNPNVPMSNYNINMDNMRVPMPISRRALNWAAQSPGGAFVMNAGDAVSLGTLDNFTDNPELARAGMAAVSAQHPKSSFAGTMTGAALATAGAEAAALRAGLGKVAPIAGDALYGVLYGAGSDDENRARGALWGGVSGAGGGVVGRTATDVAGNAARGIRNEAVQMFRGHRVPMTIGDMVGQSGPVGRYIKRREEHLTEFSGVGDKIPAKRSKGIKEWNRAMFDEALAPIAAKVLSIGRRGIDEAMQLVSKAYERALAGKIVIRDGAFEQEFGRALEAVRRIPRLGDEIARTINERIVPLFGPDGTLTGERMQAALEAVRAIDSSYKSNRLWKKYIAPAIDESEAALTRLIERQEPGTIADMNAANAAYWNLSVLDDAVMASGKTNGVFTPRRLGLEYSRRGPQLQSTRAAQAQRPFLDLNMSARKILVRGTPDGSTAGRGLPTRRGGIRNAVSAPLYSDTLQPVYERLLLDRPDWMIRAGNEMVKHKRVGGLFGAPLAITTATGRD
jgi:hypothetical protein